jgi:hypothetical protein
MKLAAATTFEVSDVHQATTLLPETPYKQAVENLLANSGPVEACSRFHGRLIDRLRFHPLVGALHFAFLDHRPVVLSPDMIWLLICQGVANHINANSERLRSRLVKHTGKVEIRVGRNDLVKGSPENPWPEVFHLFSAAVRRHVGPAIDRFLPNFTTTGPVERAACEVVLLDAMQSYFKYIVATICGIPAITLEGTSQDWQTLAERAMSFADLDLDWWLKPLSSILNKFSEAAKGDIDVSFWRSLYKYHDQEASGGPYITGSIMGFFPYLKDSATGSTSVRNLGFMEVRGQPIFHPGGRLTHADLPGGLSKAPFIWEYSDKFFDMEFLGGFVGVAQDQETLALRPEIGWAVREAPTHA